MKQEHGRPARSVRRPRLTQPNSNGGTPHFPPWDLAASPFFYGQEAGLLLRQARAPVLLVAALPFEEHGRPRP
jgi:hypothetical protein